MATTLAFLPYVARQFDAPATPRGRRRHHPLLRRPRPWSPDQQRTTLLLVDDLGQPAFACRVSGGRYVLCLESIDGSRRPVFATITRETLRTFLGHGTRIVGRC